MRSTGVPTPGLLVEVMGRVVDDRVIAAGRRAAAQRGETWVPLTRGGETWVHLPGGGDTPARACVDGAVRCSDPRSSSGARAGLGEGAGDQAPGQMLAVFAGGADIRGGAGGLGGAARRLAGG